MATHEELIQRWTIEAGREKPRFLFKSDGNLFVSRTDGILYYDREGRGQFGRGNPARNILLARFIGDRYNGGMCLLNGDGFEDRTATEWQTRVRNAMQAHFGWERCAVIPFQALDGAGIDYSTLKIIEVTQDTNDSTARPLPPDFALDEVLVNPQGLKTLGFKRVDGAAADPNHSSQTWEGLYRSVRFRVSTRNMSALGSRDSYSGDKDWAIYSVDVWAQPQFGSFGWQRLSRVNYTTPRKRNERTGDNFYAWQWTERIHRLGSVVFYGNGPDGRRHRWISAFDMQEPDGLYFLAQCPDQGKCKTYQEAIDLLAPPLVHQARASGRQVYRQGDVFAVEISWDDAQVYENSIMRVRRQVVLQDLQGQLVSGRRPIDPAEGEVVEKGTCPFCTGIHKFGNGPKARRALMIHGTGHTADEVVIKKNGVTYVRGTMYHDPVLEDATRAPDHTPIRLESLVEGGHGWFVAIRNTVPRVRAPRQVTDSANNTAAGRDRAETVAREANQTRRRQRADRVAA